MRNMCLGITAVVVTVGMVSVGAQGRSFSGTWVIDSEKTMAAMQAALGETGAVVARGGGGGGRGGVAGGVVSAGGGGAVGGTAVARSGGGGGRGTGTGEVVAGGGGGVAVGGTMTASGGGGARGGRGGRGGAVGGVAVNTDTVITIDGTTFSTDIRGVHTSYPLNGSEVTVPMGSMSRDGGAATPIEGKARASWKGDMLVIETTYAGPEGPVTSTTSWYLEGDSLVRATTRMTYYKRK